MVVRGQRLLAGNEPFAGELLTDSLARGTASASFRSRTSTVHRSETVDTGDGQIHGGPVEVVVDGEEIVVDEIVVATGRTPNSSDLGPADRRTGSRAASSKLDDHLTVHGCRRELAVRRRRPHRPRAAHPHGQVPGPHLSAQSSRPGPRAGLWTAPNTATSAITARSRRSPSPIHRSRRSGVTEAAGPGRRRRRRGGRVRPGRARRQPRSTRSTTSAGPSSSSTPRPTSSSVRRSSDPTSPSWCTRPRSRSSARCRSTMLWHAVPSYPTVSEIWLRLLETYRSENS